MRYNNEVRKIEHSFDWRAFRFFLAMVALFIATGAGSHYGFTYLFANASPAKTPTVTEVVASLSPAVAEASVIPQRVINRLTIAETIPTEGKFIAADLVSMKLQLYEDGSLVSEYPIQTKGRAGTPWETPSGFYSIKTKEENHFSSIGDVYMPYSMQFYGNYFIHGWTYYPDGTPTKASFSGGCIKLNTDDAAKVFAFADIGTKVFVYDNKQTNPPPPLLLGLTAPSVSADSYMVVDIDTDDVYAEKNATKPQPLSAASKLVAALVANEVISLERSIPLAEGEVDYTMPESTETKHFFVNDLFYPLLMQPGTAVGKAIGSYYGSKNFLRWMNSVSYALDMGSTTFADISGDLPESITSAEDMYRLLRYLSTKKSFIFKIADTKTKTIKATDGVPYIVRLTETAQQRGLSVLSFTVGGKTRQVAIITMGAEDHTAAQTQLSEWITKAALSSYSEPACVGCALPDYRKIEP